MKPAGNPLTAQLSSDAVLRGPGAFSEVPIVKLSQIQKVLFRAIPFVEKMPEHNLMFAVLMQAVADMRDGRDEHKADAVRFFGDGRSESICGFLELNADFVRELLEKYWLRTSIVEWVEHHNRFRGAFVGGLR